MKAPLVNVRAHQKRTNERWRLRDESAETDMMLRRRLKVAGELT
jgi:hypothetical protein